MRPTIDSRFIHAPLTPYQIAKIAAEACERETNQLPPPWKILKVSIPARRIKFRPFRRPRIRPMLFFM